MSHLMSSVERLHGVLSQLGVNDDPIIALGMHRSGTTLLVRILQAAGVFMGERLSGNLEPQVIQDANRQIFDYYGASWLNADLLPSPSDLNTGFNGLASNVADRLAEDMSLCFFPANNFRLGAWGFKDPRTCVTAGLFAKLFPNARAVFIHRNPFDVVSSIVTRELKIRRKYPGNATYEFTTGELSALTKKAIIAWENYNKRAIASLQFFKTKTELSYEYLLNDHKNEIKRITSDLGIESSGSINDSVTIDTNKIRSSLDIKYGVKELDNYLDKYRSGNYMETL